METKIKKIFKYIFIAVLLFVVVAPLAEVQADTQTGGGQTNLYMTVTATQNSGGGASFTAKVTDGNCSAVLSSCIDYTSDFSFQWSLTPSSNSGTLPLAETTSSFTDPLTGVPPGTYTVNATATATQSAVLMFSSGAQVTGHANLTLGSGATTGYSVKIDSANQTASPTGTGINNTNTLDSGNWTYQLVAEIDDANGNAVVGGPNNASSQSGWSFAWTYSTSASNQGPWNPLQTTGNSNGYSVSATFPSGSYWVQTTATNTSSGGSITSPLVTIAATNSGGLQSSNSNGITISCTPYSASSSSGTSGTSGSVTTASSFPYQCQANFSSSAPGSGYWENFDWTVNGTDLGKTTSQTQQVTFVTGSNTVTVIATLSDNSTLRNTVTYTVGSNGAITGTNGSSNSSTNPGSACSGSLSSGISCIVARIYGALLGFAANILAWLTSELIVPTIVTVISIQPHTAAFSAVIVQEWVFIRNLCNIFFIAAMIILGIGTLLRAKSYNWKSTIPRLILAALTVNFSLAFSQAIIGVADVAQAQFLGVCQTNNSGGIVSSVVGQYNCQSQVVVDNLAFQLMTQPISSIQQANVNNVDSLTISLVTETIYFIVAIGAMFAFIALAAFLVIRIVVLWILLMTSPVGYVFGMFPMQSIRKWSGVWWSNFWKYTFFTPLIALFLHICALLATTQSAYVSGTANNIGQSIASQPGTAGTTQAVATSIITAILVAACLGFAIKIAQSMGIEGAAKVTKFTGDMEDKLFGTAKTISGDYLNRTRRNLGGRAAFDEEGNPRKGFWGGVGKLTNSFLNPETEGIIAQTKAGWKRKNEEAATLAEARAKRTESMRRTGFDNRADAHILEKKQDERVDKYMRMDRDGWNNAFTGLKNNEEGNKERVAALTAAAKSGLLKKVAPAAIPDKPTPEEIAAFIGSSLPAGISSVDRSHFFESLDDLGKEKKDLSLVGLGEDRGLPYANRNQMFQARANLINDMDAEDLAKIKPAGIDNDRVRDAFISKVNSAPSTVANGIGTPLLTSLGDHHAAEVMKKMDASGLLRVDSTLLASGAEMQQALVSAAVAQPTDVADKLNRAMLGALTADNRAQAITSMTGNNAIKVDPALIDGAANQVVRSAVLSKIQDNNSLTEQLSQAMRNKFNGPEVKTLVDNMTKTAVANLEPAYFAAHSEAKDSIVGRINRGETSVVEKMSWDALSKFNSDAEKAAVLTAIPSEKLTGITASYMHGTSSATTSALEKAVGKKLGDNQEMIDKVSNEVLNQLWQSEVAVTLSGGTDHVLQGVAYDKVKSKLGKPT